MENHSFAVNRSAEKIGCLETQKFWDSHPNAFQFNTRLAAAHTNVETEELRICDFVDNLKIRLPGFFLVSDSPAYDVRLLDQILLKHGRSGICMRSTTIYHPCLCTWSYQLAVAHSLGCKVKKVLQQDIARRARDRRTVRPIETFVRTSLDPAHTSLYDCAKILCNYFNVLDLVAEMSNVNKNKNHVFS
jgi:hypothetical protein